MKMIEQIKEFQRTFDEEPKKEFTDLSGADIGLRYFLQEEELEEWSGATFANDPVATLDAITDQLYILLGTACKQGLIDCIPEAFSIVHAANMRKLDKDGKVIRREDGKVLKPEGWKGPEEELKLLLKMKGVI